MAIASYLKTSRGGKRQGDGIRGGERWRGEHGG
jgi:hypothetical protein